MLLKILRMRIHQLGGLRTVREYAKVGVLWPMVKTILRNPFSRESYKRAYAVALKKVEGVLTERYRGVMRESAGRVASAGSASELKHEHPKLIWFCWMQGMENAPAIVKACYESQSRLKVNGYEVKLIDASNWREYIELPDYVVRKWEKGWIPPAHFSDLLRLELLIRYGGTWMDATILYTGVQEFEGSKVQEYLEADLFMFQYTRPGSEVWGGIGNWFISACRNNPVLMALQEMLYAYWRDYDCVVDYYIFHLFFSKLREVFPEEIAAMPYGYARRPLALVHHWSEPFNQEQWDRLVGRTNFHKLTYMVEEKVKRDEGNYYNYVINEYKQ